MELKALSQLAVKRQVWLVLGTIYVAMDAPMIELTHQGTQHILQSCSLVYLRSSSARPQHLAKTVSEIPFLGSSELQRNSPKARERERTE